MRKLSLVVAAAGLVLATEERAWAGTDDVAVRNVIHRQLLIQEAERRKLEVTEQDLDDAVTALRGRFPDLRSMGAWMKEQSLDDRSLLETLRTQLLVARVTSALVAGVSVDEGEVRRFHERNVDDLRFEEVRIQVIVVREKSTAEEVLAALREGDDFAGLARRWSVGRRAAKGGDTGWVDSANLGPPLRAVVAALGPGEAHGPVPAGSEFLVVRLEARRPGRVKSFAESRSEIERRLLAERRQDALQGWLVEREMESKGARKEGATP